MSASWATFCRLSSLSVDMIVGSRCVRVSSRSVQNQTAMLVRINHRVGFRLHCLFGNPLFEPECLADGLW